MTKLWSQYQIWWKLTITIMSQYLIYGRGKPLVVVLLVVLVVVVVAGVKQSQLLVPRLKSELGNGV